MGDALYIPSNTASYQCLSTDIVGGKAPGAGHQGANLYITDTGLWYRVLSDLTLIPLSHQISGSIATIGTISGSITTGSLIDINNFPTTQEVSGSITINNTVSASLVGSSINVDNTVSASLVGSSINVDNVVSASLVGSSINVDNFPNTYSGSITNLPNAYSGSITNLPDAYSGSITNFPDTYSGSITNFPNTYSGSITNLPDAYSGSITNLPDAYSGSITNLPDTYEVSGSVNVLNFPENTAISGSVKTILYDISGSPISSNEGVGEKVYLGVSTVQDVHTDNNNSSTTNLDAGNSYTFTGVASSTLGVVGLQWSLKTDQNATVYVEESPDGTNWDISYHYNYIASNGGEGETVQATQSYWRIRVILDNEINTTYFRLQGVLCPIATPLPSSLSDDARLKVETTITGRENIDRHGWISPLGDQLISPRYRLIGHSFSGIIKDTNFWEETVTYDAVVIQSGGAIYLNSGSTANGTAEYKSIRKARFVAGSPNMFVSLADWEDAEYSDNIRRIGAFDDNEGFFFELDYQTFSIGSRKSGADTLISSGSFNGNFGNIWSPNVNTHYKLSIEFLPKGVFWYINTTLLHKLGTAHLTNTLTLPCRIENINYNGQDTDVGFRSAAMLISREGQLITAPTYRFIGTDTTTILKYGAGILQRIINLDNAGDVVVYDNTSATGAQIAVIDSAKALGTLEFNAHFSNGLTIVTTGTAKITVIYE